MKKWYNEEYSFEIEVTGFLRGDHTERYCRNGEEIGDKYSCTYGCPVNAQGYRDLFKSNDDVISRHGSCQKRRKFRKYWGELINTARILYVLMAVSCLNLQPKNWEMKNFIKGKFFD